MFTAELFNPERLGQPRQVSASAAEAANELEAELAGVTEESDVGRRRRAGLARRILELDRSRTDAMLELAEHCDTDAERLALLRDAVRTSRRLWADGRRSHQGIVWWYDLETRPFMRAVLALGRAYADVGETDAAFACFDALLDMSPEDALGARFDLQDLGPPTRRF